MSETRYTRLQAGRCPGCRRSFGVYLPAKGYPGQETDPVTLACPRCGADPMVTVHVPDGDRGRVALRMGWTLMEGRRPAAPLWPWTWLRLTAAAPSPVDRVVALATGGLVTAGFLALVSTLEDRAAVGLIWGTVAVVVLSLLAVGLRGRR